MRRLRTPLVHFVAGGAVLFICVDGPARRVAHRDVVEPVVMSAEDVEHLGAAYARDTGLPRSPADEAALVDDAIDEELLVREARARGLDRHDRSIRAWLIEQMQVLSPGGGGDAEALYGRAVELGLDRSDLVVRRILVHKMRLLAARLDEEPPSDETLRAFFAAHGEDYRAPERVSFSHVFFANATRGARSHDEAAALVAALRHALEPAADAIRRGDSFGTSPHVRGWSTAQVAKLFGPAFAAALERAPTRSWFGPVASAYGMHVVWLDARESGALPAFEIVRGRVRERWLDAERADRVARLLRELRRRTPLRVDSAPWQARGRS